MKRISFFILGLMTISTGLLAMRVWSGGWDDADVAGKEIEGVFKEQDVLTLTKVQRGNRTEEVKRTYKLLNKSCLAAYLESDKHKAREKLHQAMVKVNFQKDGCSGTGESLECTIAFIRITYDGNSPLVDLVWKGKTPDEEILTCPLVSSYNKSEKN